MGQRQRFHRLAEELRKPFLILEVRASEDVLRERIKDRAEMGKDASEANLSVLDHQMAHAEPFSPDERPFVFCIDSEQPLPPSTLIDALKKKLSAPGN